MLNALNISAFASITMCTKLYFNMAVKIWLNPLDISSDIQIFSKNLLMIMHVGKCEFIFALKISEFAQLFSVYLQKSLDLHFLRFSDQNFSASWRNFRASESFSAKLFTVNFRQNEGTMTQHLDFKISCSWLVNEGKKDIHPLNSYEKNLKSLFLL